MIRILISLMFSFIITIPIFGQEEITFPDSMYRYYNWNKFLQIEKLRDTIDFRDVDYSLLNAAVFFFTNKARIEHGRIPLAFSPALRNMANFHSSEMMKHEFVDHFNLRNLRFSTVKKRSKYFKADAAGENVASVFLYHYKSGSQFFRSWNGVDYDFFTQENELIPKHSYFSFAEQLVQNWMDSKPHRENILFRSFRKMGCAVSVSPNDMKNGYIPMGYGTQNFGY